MRPHAIGILFLILSLSNSNGFCQCWPRLQKSEPREEKDFMEGFGDSLDQDGDILVVGAQFSDSIAYRAGLVYVFKKTLNGWEKIADLFQSDHTQNRFFGQRVSISGTTIAVTDSYFTTGVVLPSGYTQQGAVYIYEMPSGGWTNMSETQRIAAVESDNISFGNSVDLHGDHLIIGAMNTLNENKQIVGAAYIFSRAPSGWSKLAKLSTNKESYLGASVAITESFCVVTTENEYVNASWTFGPVYVFEKPASGWVDMQPTARLTRSKYTEYAALFGDDIAIDENTIFLTDSRLYTGNYYGPALYVYNKPSSGWANAIEDASYYDSTATANLYNSKVSLDGEHAYFTGYDSVIVFKKSGSAWSLLEPHAYIKPAESSSALGKDISAQNGKVFIGDPGSQHLFSPYETPIEESKIFEMKEPASGWSNVATVPDDIIEFAPLTGSGSNYGAATDVDGKFAVVGAPGDKVRGMFSGAAYILAFDGINWQRVAKLSPSDSQPYDNFGWNVSIKGDYVAVTSVFHDKYDETGKFISFDNGAVYVFQKPSGGWRDMTETYKATLDDPNIKSFGRAVSIEMPYLVVGQYEDRSSEDLGYTFVLELKGNRWEKIARLSPKDIQPGSGFGNSLAIQDSVIVVGCRPSRFWFQEGNRAYVYERPATGWKDTTESALLYPSDVGMDGYLVGRMFGSSVDISGDDIIAGAPGWIDQEGVFGNFNLFRGAAYIFTKPQNGWKGIIKETTRLTPGVDIPYHCFGYSVRIEERFAIIGAPQNIFFTYGSENPGAGKVYFFKKPEEGWKAKMPDKVITGDDSESTVSDYFGSSVASTFGYMFVGALLDNNSTGIDAGSVYVYTEYPYIAEPKSPMCANDNPITLQAYPSGGLWSGSGVVDANAGIFDPSQASLRNIISYKVDDCDASNTAVIRIIEKVTPFKITVSDSLFFCGKDSVRLSVLYKKNHFYEWTVSKDQNNFSLAPDNYSRNVYDAKTEGHYKLSLSNGCSTETDTVWVGDLPVEAGLNFQTCLNYPSTPLIGMPSGGQWIGTGVATSQPANFSPLQAGLGNHQLLYEIQLYPGCDYTDSLSVLVGGMPSVKISSIDSSRFCIQGFANLTASEYANTFYEWLYAEDPNRDFKSLSIFGSDAQAEFKGVYKVKAVNEKCELVSPPFILNPTFKPKIDPTTSPVSFCWNSEQQLKAEQIVNADYRWLFSSQKELFYSYVAGNNAPQLTNPETGFYKVEIETPGCHFLSEPIEVIKIKKDSVFIPNVITPNDDRFNDVLEIKTQAIDTYNFKVYNRYGSEVFSATENSPPWNGDVSYGVYYWIFVYPSSCEDGKNKILKGSIQVLGH